MKEQIETAVPRSKFVAGDSDKARNTATGHSCETLYHILIVKNNKHGYRKTKILSFTNTCMDTFNHYSSRIVVPNLPPCIPDFIRDGLHCKTIRTQ